MQQAYRSIRVVAETETIRIVLPTRLNESTLQELRSVCATLQTEGSSGIKALVLDFTATEAQSQEVPPTTSLDESLKDACAALDAVPVVSIAVLRGSAEREICELIQSTDLILAASEATICASAIIPGRKDIDVVNGEEALRLRLVNQVVAESQLKATLAKTLDLLRPKSAVALRMAKVALRQARNSSASRLETLAKINDFYLTQTMQTADAHEGLRSFLEKREPTWKNH